MIEDYVKWEDSAEREKWQFANPERFPSKLTELPVKVLYR